MSPAKLKPSKDYDQSVFLNCPFDDDYRPLFRALLFTIQDAGFLARCALEVIDAGQVRLDKILGIIAACRLGVHDISRTELDTANDLPRFNMPFELGLDLGARAFGRAHRGKVQIILDRERYRYQKYLSDIAGQDISAHGNDPAQVVRLVRNWLRTVSKNTAIPGAAKIQARLALFERELPDLCAAVDLDPKEIPFADLTNLIFEWLKSHPLAGPGTGK